LVRVGGPNPQVIATVLADMARGHYYDRNAASIVKNWGGSIPAGSGWTQRWSYTVPAGKKAMHTLLYDLVGTAIATAGTRVLIRRILTRDAVSTEFNYFAHWSTTDPFKYLTLTAEALFLAGDVVSCETNNNDTVAHLGTMTSLLVEFDA